MRVASPEGAGLRGKEPLMRRALKLIDSINNWVGEQLKYVCLFLIVVVVLEVALRYFFNHPTQQLPVIQTWTGTAFYALAFGYVLLLKGHVRVDVLYGRWSDRVKAIVDTVLWFVFFLPVMGLLTYTSYLWTIQSWQQHERSMMTYWYPPYAPIRTIVAIGFTLFLLQGVATVIRDIRTATGGEPL